MLALTANAQTLDTPVLPVVDSFAEIRESIHILPEPPAVVELSPQEIIAEVANREGIPVSVMLAIADAESDFNPNAKNPHSTATGVFQFLIGTWGAYNCPGSRVNARDNIECFATVMQHDGYPKGLSHWNASKWGVNGWGQHL